MSTRHRLDPLPAAPFTADVRLWRTETVGPCKSNVPRTVIHHSPDGFNYGYEGSGPADLALNILNAFVPPRDASDRIPLRRGACSVFAWDYHHEFKREFLARIEGTCAILHAAHIRAWIDERLGTSGVR